MKDTPLGRFAEYKSLYDPSLLYSLPRGLGRKDIINYSDAYGFDIWNCYELSWLSLSGKPEIRILEFAVPSSSDNIVESKSLKLYLNSFNDTKFGGEQEVLAILRQDLTNILGEEISLSLKRPQDYLRPLFPSAIDLDSIEIEIKDYSYNKDFLELEESGEFVKESLFSELLKSNCPVTGQPDWAQIQIIYSGRKIVHTSLLKYIISMRGRKEFHEQCIERIFSDIREICMPKELTVQAGYTRRGGIDINPIRSTHDLKITEVHNFKHSRQ